MRSSKLTIEEQDGRRSFWLNGLNVTKYIKSCQITIEPDAITDVKVNLIPRELVFESDNVVLEALYGEENVG